ncbi:MAG TPA: NTP transferase domain-containing protein [Planctomycetota bacterium]|nr:NTP transferase domain-containing protein [Planctomycetota bacterium]
MADAKLAAVILAAGQGKRMGGVAKVLCRSGGRTLIDAVIAAARAAGAGRVVCVLGHEKEKVAASLPAGVEWVEQRERLGTGHAAMQAEPLLKGFDGEVLVLCGDTPLLKSDTLSKLVAMVRKDRAAAAVLTFDAPPGNAYGRIIREDGRHSAFGLGLSEQPSSRKPKAESRKPSSVEDPGGRVLRIVEAKDATPAELAVREVNSGSYCFRAGELFARLGRLTNKNAQGEYYLTDVVGLLIADGLGVAALKTDDPDEALGVNSPEDLAAVEAALARRAAGPAGGR